MSVVFDASGEGATPSFSSRARMKLSIGLRGHARSVTAGGSGRVTLRKGPMRGLLRVADSAEQANRRLDRSRRAASRFHAAVRRAPAGGITFFSVPATMWMRRLAALFPGWITWSAASFRSSRKPLICCCGPWQMIAALRQQRLDVARVGDFSFCGGRKVVGGERGKRQNCGAAPQPRSEHKAYYMPAA